MKNRVTLQNEPQKGGVAGGEVNHSILCSSSWCTDTINIVHNELSEIKLTQRMMVFTENEAEVMR